MKKPKLRFSLLSIAALLPALLFGQIASKPKPAEAIQKPQLDSRAYIAMLENPQRDAEQKPGEVIAALGLKNGETIADIGAGAGYFALRFAPLIGNGRVYAVDINPDMILQMNKRIRELRLNNVSTILSAPDDPLLPDNSINCFFICNTWHQIENQPKYLGLMKRMMKPGGQVVIIDYKMRAQVVGPQPEKRVQKREVIKQFESNGFKLAGEHDFLPNQYFLIFSMR
jgi:ubiquinone/menaquinone biosynthesis C-methylase UbiE